jgi:hypothetical protein
MKECSHRIAIADYCATCDFEKSRPVRAPSKRGIYVASRTRYAGMWRGLRAIGAPIAASWIEWTDTPTALRDHWVQSITEVGDAAALIVYCGGAIAGEEPLPETALLEIGGALARGVPVFVVGPLVGTWMQHPLVTRCVSMDDAIAQATDVAERAR